ncbi:MAG: S-layer homology domain-containing protein [Clostridia bacterium]|nr:S-layer homology domain-containing protein [Clostridia bacterium]
MKRRKSFVALISVFSMLAGTLSTLWETPAQAIVPGVDFPVVDYYTDPNVISDEDFFGVWNGTDWQTPSMLNYEAYPDMKGVREAVYSGDYITAKEEMLEYYKNKFSEFPLESTGKGTAAQYLGYIKYKNNLLTTENADCSAVAVMSADNDWDWIEVDITRLLTAAEFHDESKTFSFFLNALNKDDSIIEIKSRECGDEYAPRIEASVNSEIVEFPAIEDAYISAGSNIYTTFGAQDEMLLKVAESTTSIGKLDDPVDENTFRSYLKFNFDSIVRGDTVSKAVLKVYARNAGGTGKKDMLLNQSGETIWKESTISWGCGDITHHVYSFDGEIPGWDMTKAQFANPRIVTNPIRFGGVPWAALGYYHTTKNEEVMYHIIRMMISYIKMKPDPTFNNNLSSGNRAYHLSRLVAYATQSDMMTPDVFTGFVKYFKVLGDYLETEKAFNPNNNWGVYESDGLICLAWIFNELTVAEEWERIALERLDYMSGNVSFEDGSSVECAVGYAGESLLLLTDTLLEIVRFVGKDIDELGFSDGFRDRLYRQAKYIMDVAGPGFVCQQYGDSANYTVNYRSRLENANALIDADDLLWASAGGPSGNKGAPPNYTSVFYPVKGEAVMRSDWSENGLYLHINNDKARRSHGHADDLSVIVFANGRYLLADPYIYVYNPEDDPIRQWLFSTRAHNTVMINNTTQKIAKSEADPGEISGWETNDAFDYVKMMTEMTQGYKHTRDVMFIKNKFWIINDLLEPDNKTSLNQYEQLWHFLPEANISVDPATMETRTNFGDADMKVIPVDTMDYEPVQNFYVEDFQESGDLESLRQDDTSSGIKVGYFSLHNGSVTNAEYSSYRKVNVAGDTTFNTILFPVTVMNDYDVETMAIPTDLEETQAAAIEIDYTNKKSSAVTKGIYYNLLDESQIAERAVENYSTDGQTMYVEKESNVLSSVILRGGSHVKDTARDVELIKSSNNVDAVSVKWQSKSIYIDSMNELNLEDITVYTNEREINNVYVNGVALEQGTFKTQGRYIYFGGNPIIPDDTVVVLPDTTPDNSPNNTHGNGNDNSGTQGGGTQGGSQGNTSGGSAQGGAISGGSNSSKYSDVEEGRWSQVYIEKLSEMGVLSGIGDGTFGPEMDIKRDEFIKILLEAFKIPATEEGESTFNDVNDGEWNEKYIKTAARLGIINGISPNEFGTGLSVSRQDAAVMIKRTLDYLNLEFPKGDATTVLSDIESVDEYAAQSVDLLISQGIIIGNENGEFVPKGNISREQIAKIVVLTLEKSGYDFEE